MNSYWISSIQNLKNKNPNIEKLDSTNQINKNTVTDVCIIGAGLAGLSTAYYLAQNGVKVAIVDKAEIGTKTSGHTTAKITLQHGLIYDYLINTFGFDYALSYFRANEKAISNIKHIIDSENIDCDFEYKNNYIYTTFQDDLTKIHNEIKAVNSLASGNISNAQNNSKNIMLNAESTYTKGNSMQEDYAQFVKETSLPFKIAGAIETKNQAQFHPTKYMYGLAKAIQNNGGLIFTNTLVTDVQKYGDGYITYANDYTIKSKYIVIASHYPFINFPGFYFSKMYQSTSYVVAIETNKKLPDGMYINTGEPVLSFRTAKYYDPTCFHASKSSNTNKQNNSKNILIISGGDHKTGYSPDSESFYGYKYVEEQAKKHFPDCKILYKWNTRDCITLDKIPYIGEFSMFMPNAYVATGFNKWGMTSSNIAANIIKDEILGYKNLYATTFDSNRFKPIKNRGEMKNMVKQVFHSFVSNRIKIPDEDLSSIKNDNGGIIRINGTAVGIYKDKDGKIYAIDPTCTHLGCLLTWNNVDKTWDCPCHGSRFDYKGKNLYDPAFKDLETFGIN